MADPYAAPKAPIDQQKKEDPPTIGYLIGGLIQLCSGVTCFVFGLAGGGPAAIGCGLFMGFFGVRAVVKYRARRGRVSSPHA